MLDAKSRIIDLCRRRSARGMPAHMIDAVVRMLSPSIRLIPDPNLKTDIGRSRIGGLPDLPVDLDWPVYEKLPNPLPSWAPGTWTNLLGQPLEFLLQVNLSETGPFDVQRQLPDSGMLYFFYLDLIERFDLSPRPDEIVYVHFVPGTIELHRAPAPSSLPSKFVYRAFVLSPRLEWTIPEPYDLWKEGIDQTEIDSQLEQWSDLIDCPSLETEVAIAQGFLPEFEPKHRLLGHPQLIQAFCTANRCPDARLLLQLDSDYNWANPVLPQTGMMWGDAGRIFFYISQDDLNAQRFSHIWAHEEMH
jgi:uncharacterized protein YwqG